MQRDKNLYPTGNENSYLGLLPDFLNERESKSIEMFCQAMLCRLDECAEKPENYEGWQTCSGFDILYLCFSSIIKFLNTPTYENGIDAANFIMMFTDKDRINEVNPPNIKLSDIEVIEELFSRKYGYNEKKDKLNFGVGLIETKYFSVDASLLLGIASTKSNTTISIYIKDLQKPMIVSYLSEEARDTDYSSVMKQWSEYKMNIMKQNPGSKR